MLQKKFLSNSTLKLIAILIMLIDHFAASDLYHVLANHNIIFPGYSDTLYLVFRSIGRLAFPIFAFLIAEGYYYTRNPLRYLKRLIIFAFISEIPFDLAFRQPSLNSLDPNQTAVMPILTIHHVVVLELGYQNVFFTLALGLICIYLYDKYLKNGEANSFLKLYLAYFGMIIAGIFAVIFNTDYSIFGVVLILFFYVFRGDFRRIVLLVIGINLLMCITSQNWLEMLSVFSLIFIYFYNNKKGFNLKYLFYLFYPVHLLLLFLFRYVVSGS